MNKINQWAMTVSIVSIISGILISLLPKSSYKDFYKALTTIVLVYALIQPIDGNRVSDFEINEYLKDNYTVSNNIDKYANSSVILSAENAIEELLMNECGTLDMNVSFDCECSIDGETVSVKEIRVNGISDSKHKDALYEIIESMGFERNILIFAGEYK